MADVIKGTTPTITFTFSNVKVADVDKAVLTIKSGGEIIIEHDIASATVDAEKNAILWTMTQQESLSLSGCAEIMLNWVTEDGTRGASAPTHVHFTPNHKEVII